MPATREPLAVGQPSASVPGAAAPTAEAARLPEEQQRDAALTSVTGVEQSTAGLLTVAPSVTTEPLGAHWS